MTVLKHFLSRSTRIGASALLACSLLLGGCASVTPSAETPGSEDIATRQYQDNIAIVGRLSVQYQQNGNEEFLHGGFTWNQQAQRSDIALISPLGQTMATLVLTPDGAILSESGKPPSQARDVDALVAQTLGWPLPVAGLQHWLQGFGINSNGQRFVATNQDTPILTQDGWQLRYANWQRGEAGAYAKRIDLVRQTRQLGKVEIRIVIDQWQPG